MFESLMNHVEAEVARRVFRIQIQQMPETTMPLQQAVEVKPEEMNAEETAISSLPAGETGSAGDLATALASIQGKSFKSAPQPGVKQSRIGRNDPCWCGSGKKFKKCHYPQLPS